MNEEDRYWLGIGLIMIVFFSIGYWGGSLVPEQQQKSNWIEEYNVVIENALKNCPDTHTKYELVVETESYSFYIPYNSTVAIIGKIPKEKEVCITRKFNFVNMKSREQI